MHNKERWLYPLIVLHSFFIFLLPIFFSNRRQLHMLLTEAGACDAHLSLGEVRGIWKEGNILHSPTCKFHTVRVQGIYGISNPQFRKLFSFAK